MARSVISNTHFRGDGAGAKARSGGLKNHKSSRAEKQRANKLASTATVALTGSSGTLADFAGKHKPALPLLNSSGASDAERNLIIEPVIIAEQHDASGKKVERPKKKKATSTKSAPPKKKASVKKPAKAKTAKKTSPKKAAATKRAKPKKAVQKKAAPKRKAKGKIEAKTAKPATKTARNQTGKSARTRSEKTTRPNAPRRQRSPQTKQFPHPGQGIDAQHINLRTGQCRGDWGGTSTQSAEEFHLWTITSKLGRESIFPWQQKTDGEIKQLSKPKPLPRGSALQLYKKGGLLGQIRYWFKQSALRLWSSGKPDKQTAAKRKPKNGTIKIKGQALVAELNRLTKENKELRLKIAEMKMSA